MRLDIQSLVNLHPFFKPEHLLAWQHQESELFLKSIRNGRMDTLLGRLGRFNSANDLTQFTGWWLAEYLVSGGQCMWFPGTIKAMARQHANRIKSHTKKYRFPLPGGRYYIMPAEISEKQVGRNQVHLDPESSTAWVNSADWNEYIVDVLGGCDGDDSVWIFPFKDYDGCKKILMWRSPNQLGEYVILQPTETATSSNGTPHIQQSHFHV